MLWPEERVSVEQMVDSFTKEPPAVEKPLRMPVQDIYKFTEGHDERRIVAGRIETGSVSVGDEVVFLPSLKRAKVASIEEFSKSQGVKWLKDMKEPSKPGAGGKIEGALDKERVDELNGSILEIRGRLEFLQKMIEEWRDKPLVEETLIGG